MKSNDVSDHGVSDGSAGQAKKPWITPSIEIIAFQSAAGGKKFNRYDGPGAHPIYLSS